MGTTQFVPLTAQLIDEGDFLANLDEELRDLQEGVVKFLRQHRGSAKDAKAKLVVELELKVEEPDDDAFSLKSSFKSTMPKRPASVSLALGGETDDGKMALFVRKSGSDENHPKQLKLATRDGKVINQETGEVMDGDR